MKHSLLALFLAFSALLRGQATLPPEMVFVEGGTFTMGCTPEQQPCNSWESPTRIVRIPAFWIGKFEVTQGIWENIMGNNNPPPFQDNLPSNPMERISYYDCLTFCNRLSKANVPPLEPCYYFDSEYTSIFDTLISSDSFAIAPVYFRPEANGYRLPTESEWEFAARGGMEAMFQTKYSGSDNLADVAWYANDGSAWGSKIVGQKHANALGVFDMSGNVWEWIFDTYYSYGYYSSCFPDNKTCIRSGDWADGDLLQYRTSNRGSWYPGLRHALVGLRLARNAD